MATIEIFSGPDCGYCERAKALLNERGLDYVEYDISNEAHRTEFARRLPRARTIPQIFIGGEHIGGEQDLAIIDGDGRLDKMLADGS